MSQLSARLQSSGVTPRSSSRAQLPMRRLNTIEESGSAGELSAISANPHSLSPGVDEVRGPGSLESEGRRAPVIAPRRRSSARVDGDEDPTDSECTGEQEQPVHPPQLPPPRGWVPENQDPRENGTGNALLRHLSQGSRGSERP